jgi:hypothetical protein
MASPFVRTEQTEFFVCSNELDAYTRAGKLKNMAHVTLIFVTKKVILAHARLINIQQSAQVERKKND